MIGGCDVSGDPPEATAIRDIGLPASGVPPSGEGIAPISGRGGDGSPVVTAVGGWSTGPGAVRWYGGQWAIPYSAHPGASITNAWCEIKPRADATALVELVSSNGQVLGSSTVPATAANIVIRSWPFVGNHQVTDGEQVVMRISPRDSATGAWTSANQEMTVIACSARSLEGNKTIVVPPTSFASSTWSFVVGSNGMRSNSSGILVGGIPLHAGDVVHSVQFPTAGPSVFLAVKSADATMTETVLGSGSGSASAPNVWTPNSITVPDAVIQGGLDLIFTASAAGATLGNVSVIYTPAP